MAAEFEPVDRSKKSHIEEVLVPEFDDAVIRVANMRKHQPPKCKSKATKVASNIIQYYSKVHVQADENNASSLSGSLLDDIHSQKSWEADVPHNLTSFSKVIAECISERGELTKAQQQQKANKRQNILNHNSKRSRFPRLKASHLYNTDFIVDERCM